jgi:hypothetical protein
VRRRIVRFQLQRRPETLCRLVQTVQLEKDVSKVHERRHVIRLQRQREPISPHGILKEPVLMVQLREQIDPAKLFWREAIRVQVSVASRRRE